MTQKNYDPFFNPEQTRDQYVEENQYNLKGFPFPLERDNPRGFFYRVTNTQAVKACLIQLIMTEPGERIMMPGYGTGLRRYIFDPNDDLSYQEMSNLILNSIRNWEPRIVVRSINVSSGEGDSRIEVDRDNVDSHSILISLEFSLKENLDEIEKLEFRTNLSI